MGTPLELGVGHFIAEGAKIRWALDAFEKIRPAAPVIAEQRALKNDLRTARQNSASCLRVVGEIGPGNLHDGYT